MIKDKLIKSNGLKIVIETIVIKTIITLCFFMWLEGHPPHIKHVPE